MKLKTIRRILAVSALAVAALASTVAQAVQQPVFLTAPEADATVLYNQIFSWTHGGADKYKLKFRIVETGQKLKYTMMGASCGINECGVPLYKTPLFNAVKDGQVVVWRVVAKYGTTKVKSVARTVTAEMVTAPTITPDNGAVIATGDKLGWLNFPANQSYKVVVKRASTGEVMFKESVLAGECTWVCAVDPRELADLKPGVEYKWHVKAKGFNGNKAKSVKNTFTLPFTEISS